MSNLQYFDTQTCAMQEIHNLQAFQGDPGGAMASFCRANLGKPVVWKVRDPSGNDKGAKGALYSFYFFSSPIYHGRASYGEQFTALIETEGLGKLVTTPAMVNKAYHPDHANQIWIWLPDLSKLTSWWDNHKPKRST